MENTQAKESCDCTQPSSRRPVLKWLWTACIALATMEIGWFAISIFNSSGKRGEESDADTVVDAGTVDQFKPGQVKAVPQGQFYLSRLEDGSFIALSKVCTHLGCALPWNEEMQAFVCPCHGSTFDRRGLATKSPASRPLDYYPVKIENGLIRVHIAKSLRRSSFSPSQTVKV